MLRIDIVFSTLEAVKFFQDAGLDVREIDRPADISRSHRDEITDMMPEWSVKNPYTGEYEPVKVYFMKYLQSRKRDLFLTAGKLEIYNLFKKHEQ